MKNLISLAKKSLLEHSNLNLPFAVYSAYQEQKITNVDTKNLEKLKILTVMQVLLFF